MKLSVEICTGCLGVLYRVGWRKFAEKELLSWTLSAKALQQLNDFEQLPKICWDASAVA